jgi:phosphopantetheine--protein transferase-like protein
VALARPRIDASSDAIGIDIEAVESRSERFDDMVLTAAEQRLVPSHGRDQWLTRLWTAKEAAAKATGLGLRGRPKDFEVHEVDGNRLLVGQVWVRTQMLRDPLAASTADTRQSEFELETENENENERNLTTAPIKEYSLAWTDGHA